MEFKVLSENIEWEARRVAAAFTLKAWRRSPRASHARKIDPYRFEAQQNDTHFEWTQTADGVSTISISQDLGVPCLIDLNDGWLISSETPGLNELMVRGLYCLGMEDDGLQGEGILAGLNQELNSELSNHEKLELRLSMPREFWPQKWLLEEEL